MIIEKISNVLSEPCHGFVHQANCQNRMGSGVALQVKQKYPRTAEADLNTVAGDRSKLGTFSWALNEDGKIGYNLYSQFNYGYDGKCYTDYEAMKNGLTAIKKHLSQFSTTPTDPVLAIPAKIGCTRGGGDWNIVKGILYEIFGTGPVTLVICNFSEYSEHHNSGSIMTSDQKAKLREAFKKAELMGNEF